MVAITPDVKRMMNSQHVILIGTVNDQKIPNVSPRSSFYVDNDTIYWYEIFMHKSYQNFTKNNWVSVSVVDYNEFSGYQLKGHAKIVTDKQEYFHADARLSENLPKNHEEKIRRLILDNNAKIIQFKPLVLYSLNPVDFEKAPGLLESDVDLERLQKLEEFSMLDYV